jgi:predicted  nucleic acid-binding Zn-ribbon protein
MMDPRLQRLQELQVLDSRVAGFERKLEAIPTRIQAILDGVQQSRAAIDAVRVRLDAARKDMRGKEKDLEYQGSQRKKLEAKLYEVKTNKEYSAVLAEIEAAKVEKSGLEEEILGLMELQERLTREVTEGDARLRPQEAEARAQEAAAAEELRALEVDLEAARSEREGVARDVPRDLLAQYGRLLRQRGGLAVALVGSNGICSGCRVTLTPQRFNEVRQSSQILVCESCGRFLYYQP